MTSSMDCFILVSMVLMFLFPVSTLASTKDIDTICHTPFVKDQTFCLQTLTAYPPAASATGLFPLAQIVINLGISHAEKTAGFATEAAKKEPTLKTQFMSCNKYYIDLMQNLRDATMKLKEDPLIASYDVMSCYEKTTSVKDLVGKNKDKASIVLMEMTLMMEKLLPILVGATQAIG